MGWSFSMALVKGRTRAEVLEALDLVEVGPALSSDRTTYAISQTDSGWVVLYSDELNDKWPREVAVLSRGAEALGLQLTEQVMACEAYKYEDGRRRWAVVYDCDNGPDVALRGTPPAGFQAIRSRRLQEQAEQNGADYMFEIPTDVFEQVCGYSFDEILSDWSEFTAVERRRYKRVVQLDGVGWFDRLCYWVVAFPLVSIFLLIPAYRLMRGYQHLATVWAPGPVADVLSFITVAAIVVEIVRRGAAVERRNGVRVEDPWPNSAKPSPAPAPADAPPAPR